MIKAFWAELAALDSVNKFSTPWNRVAVSSLKVVMLELVMSWRSCISLVRVSVLAAVVTSASWLAETILWLSLKKHH